MVETIAKSFGMIRTKNTNTALLRMFTEMVMLTKCSDLERN